MPKGPGLDVILAFGKKDKKGNRSDKKAERLDMAEDLLEAIKEEDAEEVKLTLEAFIKACMSDYSEEEEEDEDE